MVTKKNTKKQNSKKASSDSLEKAIEKGIEKGISNTAKKVMNKSVCSSKKEFKCDGASGWMYFLGIVGAAIYYISNATGFWSIVLSILKAFVWPAMVVLKILGL